MAIDLDKPNDGSAENSSYQGSSSSSNSNSGGSQGNHNNQGSQSRLDFTNPNSSPEVRAVYVFAYECKRKNMPEYQIEQSLMNKGLDAGQVADVMRNVNRVYHESQRANAQSDNTGGGGGGGKFAGTLIIIAIIVIIDIMSFAFGWGFIIY
jgi:hypothetical protein